MLEHARPVRRRHRPVRRHDRACLSTRLQTRPTIPARRPCPPTHTARGAPDDPPPLPSAKPVIDAHGHLLVPEANALADGTRGRPRRGGGARLVRRGVASPPTRRRSGGCGRSSPRSNGASPTWTPSAWTSSSVGPMPMHRYWAEPALAAKLTTASTRRSPRTAPPARGRLTASARCRCSTRPRGQGTGARRVGARPQGRQRLDQRRWPRARRPRPSTRCGRPPPRSARWSSSTRGAAASAPAGRPVPRQYLRPADGDRARAVPPDLRRHPGQAPGPGLLAAHGGGFLPTYIGRSDHAWAQRPDARGCAQPPSSYLRRIWYDALVYTPQALRHLVEVAGADKVVLGTDYPFDMGVTDPVERATAAGCLPPRTSPPILSGNAAALFGLTAAGRHALSRGAPAARPAVSTPRARWTGRNAAPVTDEQR